MPKRQRETNNNNKTNKLQKEYEKAKRKMAEADRVMKRISEGSDRKRKKLREHDNHTNDNHTNDTNDNGSHSRNNTAPKYQVVQKLGPRIQMFSENVTPSFEASSGGGASSTKIIVTNYKPKMLSARSASAENKATMEIEDNESAVINDLDDVDDVHNVNQCVVCKRLFAKALQHKSGAFKMDYMACFPNYSGDKGSVCAACFETCRDYRSGNTSVVTCATCATSIVGISYKLETFLMDYKRCFPNLNIAKGRVCSKCFSTCRKTRVDEENKKKRLEMVASKTTTGTKLGSAADQPKKTKLVFSAIKKTPEPAPESTVQEEKPKPLTKTKVSKVSTASKMVKKADATPDTVSVFFEVLMEPRKIFKLNTPSQPSLDSLKSLVQQYLDSVCKSSKVKPKVLRMTEKDANDIEVQVEIVPRYFERYPIQPKSKIIVEVEK